MSYDDPLTQTDFAAFRPNAEVVRYLELTRERLGLRREEMNVLDWGSGRGEYVAWLRDAGYNAFGAEIRKEAAERGKEARQQPADRILFISPQETAGLVEQLTHRQIGFRRGRRGRHRNRANDVALLFGFRIEEHCTLVLQQVRG